MLKFILAFIPLVGTTIGAGFGTVNNFNNRFEKQEDTLVAVATGILCSITFNLLFEVLQFLRYRTAILGILAGFLFSILMSLLAPKNNTTVRSKLFWAMLVHNIPEGIIIGISLANTHILPATISLILSISLQNIPDGLVVSMPLVSSKGKNKALAYGVFSGIVEPIAAILIFVAAGRLNNLQRFEPFLIGFSFSAILMIAIDLIKECRGKKVVLGTAIANLIITSIL